MMSHTLAYHTTVLHRAFSAYTTSRLQALGLSFGSLFLVIYVGKHPNCTQAQLTAALGLDWGYSQRSVTRLVQEGVLIRQKQGRAYHLSLSEKGRQAFDVSHQVFFDWDEQALSALSDGERQQLLALLAKITRKEGEAACIKPSPAP